MKRFFKYFFRILLGIVVFVFLVVFLLYLPPVQNLVRNQVVRYVNSHYDLNLKVGKLSVGFPLDLVIDDVYAGRSASDTLLSARHLRLNVGIWQLWKKEIKVDNFDLEQVKFRLSGDSAQMQLKANVGLLQLKADRVDLKGKLAEIDFLRLSEGDVFLIPGVEEKEQDTVAGKSFDWIFTARKIELDRIRFEMKSEDMPYLGAGLEQGEIVGGNVEIGQQLVKVDSVFVLSGYCHLKTAEKAPGKNLGKIPGKTIESEVASNDTSRPWTIQAQTLAMRNGTFDMQSDGEKEMELRLFGVGIRLDSIFNQGSTIRADLAELKLVQEGGVRVEEMKAEVELDSTDTDLSGGYIKTRYSTLNLSIHSDTSVAGLLEKVPLKVALKGRVGMQDLAFFYKGIPVQLADRTTSVDLMAAVSKDVIQVDRLKLGMAKHFDISGKGRLSSIRKLENISGRFMLEGNLPDVTFANEWLGNKGFRVPRNLSVSANLQAQRGNTETELHLCQGEGCLTLNADYGIPDQKYEGRLILNRFPLDRFGVLDSLGAISGELGFAGQGFDWKEANAKVDLDLRQLYFKRYDYHDITLSATLDRTRLTGFLHSTDPDLLFNLSFKSDSVEGQYGINFGGRIENVDLYALHFMARPFRIAVNLDLKGRLGKENFYGLEARLDSIRIEDIRRNYFLGDLDADFESGQTEMDLKINSGDLRLIFRGDTSLPGFIQMADRSAKELQQQIQARDLNMQEIKGLLPEFALEVEAGPDNTIVRYLKSRGIGFRTLNLEIQSRKTNGLRVGMVSRMLYYQTVKFDSVQLGVWQRNRSLAYSIGANSSADLWKDLLNLNIAGNIQGDRLRIELKQKNAAGDVGFDLGVNLTARDTGLIVSLFPMTPILGYSRWIVNADNRIVFKKDRKIFANLRLAYLNKLVSLQSLGSEGEKKDRLQIALEGIDLEGFTRLVPFVPDLAGILNANLLLYAEDGHFGTDGDIGIKELYYNQKRVGSVDLALQYVADSRFTAHEVDFELHLDSIRRVVTKGSISTSGVDKSMNIDVNILSFPLYVLNAFLPENIMTLDGNLDGEVGFRGTFERPELEGELAFQGGKVNLAMLGTSFSIDTSRIQIREDRINFPHFHLWAPNRQALTLDGSIDLNSFSRIVSDLSLTGRNFQVVDVKRNSASLVYGKAYVDVDAKITGEFSNLNISGNVNLLNNTSVVYTLRNASPELQDRSLNLVRFVSFQDTTLNEKDDLTNRINTSSFAMNMLIEIGDRVNVRVNLSDDGEDNVMIQGGGNLIFSISPESGMALVGKYILSGGSVTYNVPVVGKKEFSIQNGSFVEWTGNVANPRLSISASELVKATVEEGGSNRLVTFESIIRIQNTLSQPEITFDLSAPNDMVIQNQLATFSPEERTKQAMNLLIYNTYTGPGATTNNNANMANQALYSFIENEVNKYTRKAGFTIGVDSYNTSDETVRTDYTYEFSKQLFNDKIRVKIGGRVSTDNNDAQKNSFEENLVDDISIEYMLNKKKNLFLKVFRHTNYESVLEGEVTQTGIGIVWRKSFRKLVDLFIRKAKREARAEKQNQE